MNIKFFKELPSTNLYMKSNFESFENFDVLICDKQNHGYGRFKRNWFDFGADNLFMSICIKSDIFHAYLASITQYACVILALTFEEYKVKPFIKWPNDILISEKKISGILAESVIKSSKFKGIVLGVGVNLNVDSFDGVCINQPVTALNIEVGNVIDKQEFLNLFVSLFEKYYDDFINLGFKSFKEYYLNHLFCLNKEVTVKVAEKYITGRATSVTDSGLLVLEQNGKIIELSTGDLSD